jgi:formylglycine-generating enzyme required for sulfatase activity
VPQADDQLATVAFNTPTAITLTASDSDGGPQALTFSIVSLPQHGMLTGTPPSVTYTPVAGYSGPDSFTFKANDGAADSNLATVSIAVQPGGSGSPGTTNQSPIADDQSVTVALDTPTAITLTGSDPDSGPDALTFSIVSQPQHGTLTGTPPSVTYTPDSGYSGPDSFTFTVNDGAADSDPATVSITVQSDATLALDLGGGVMLELIRIPAGTFQMGDLSGVGYEAERPVHTVTISQPFYLGKYEVTQAQWNAVMGPTSFYRTGDNQPAEFVSWEDAQNFCAQISAMAGRTARLPSEAEWEYACRAGTTTDYSFGDDSSQLDQYAWYGGNSASQTHNVGGKLPNDWGLYDMLGNVWEMCQDWYGPYDSSPAVDPTGPVSGTQRIARGGAYGSTAPSGELRCSVRFVVDPTHAYGADAGFRLAVDAQ